MLYIQYLWILIKITLICHITKMVLGQKSMFFNINMIIHTPSDKVVRLIENVTGWIKLTIGLETIHSNFFNKWSYICNINSFGGKMWTLVIMWILNEFIALNITSTIKLIWWLNDNNTFLHGNICWLNS